MKVVPVAYSRKEADEGLLFLDFAEEALQDVLHLLWGSTSGSIWGSTSRSIWGSTSGSIWSSSSECRWGSTSGCRAPALNQVLLCQHECRTHEYVCCKHLYTPRVLDIRLRVVYTPAGVSDTCGGVSNTPIRFRGKSTSECLASCIVVN